VDHLGLYGARLAALHLHDNNGRKDSHLLPGLGTIDWQRVSARLKKTGYQGAISLEAMQAPGDKSGAEEFLRRARESLTLAYKS
jgi:sugar phosphate isomerase/epimerase